MRKLQLRTIKRDGSIDEKIENTRYGEVDSHAEVQYTILYCTFEQNKDF